MHAALPPTPADPRLQPAEPAPSCSSSRLSAALLPFGFIKLFSTETILIWIDLQFSSTPSRGLAAGYPPSSSTQRSHARHRNGPRDCSGAGCSVGCRGFVPDAPRGSQRRGVGGDFRAPPPPHTPPPPPPSSARLRGLPLPPAGNAAPPPGTAARTPRCSALRIPAAPRIPPQCVCVGGSQCHVPTPGLTG